MRQQNNYHSPLHSQDSEAQTVGCRHTNSGICAKNALQKVCALVRTDNTCYSPPASWGKQFKKLKAESGHK